MNYNNNGLYENAAYSFKDFLYNDHPRMIDKGREKDRTYVFIRIPYNSVYDAIFMAHYYKSSHLGDESKFEFACYFNARDHYITDLSYCLKQYLAYYTYDWNRFYDDTGLMYVYDKVKQVQDVVYTEVKQYVSDQLIKYKPTDKVKDSMDTDEYLKRKAMEFFVQSKTPTNNFLPSELYECDIYDCLEYDEFPQSIIDKYKGKVIQKTGRWSEDTYLDRAYLIKHDQERIRYYLDEATLDPVNYSIWYLLRKLHDCIDLEKMKTVQVTFCKVIEEQGIKKRIEATIAIDSRQIKTIYCNSNYTLSNWCLDAKAERTMESAFGGRSNWDLSANAILKITYGKKTIFSREEV